MATKYYIRVGMPWSDPQAGLDHGTDWGWARTKETAVARAYRLTRKIRTDCPVYVTDGKRVISRCGVNSGPGGVAPRQMITI